MFGFNQDPIQFVNLIAANLRDRYLAGFPILKELIQNSDDAPASELHYGLSPGLPNAEHPLLQGPGFFVINNGKFKPSDALGIRSFGQNTKAADQSSIGKFGLGMKSVFHLCETFFFLAHDGEKTYTEVLNPWSGTDPEQTLHNEWNVFSNIDAQSIKSHLSAVIADLSSDPNQCFILWLPLRQKEHLLLPSGEWAGSIVSEYPGDDPALLDFLEEPDLGVRIAALMPMLRHLKRTTFWKVDEACAEFKPAFDVLLKEDAERSSLIECGNDFPLAVLDPHHLLEGLILVARGDEKAKLEFSGREYLAWNPTLTAMHDHELWPSSYVRDDLGHSREAKDKAQPHGAVFFSRSPGRGRLISNWSVFLPLDENSAAQVISCEGGHDFRLTLHGYFFVDAGRQGVHGMSGFEGQDNTVIDSEEALRRGWNRELLRSVVLPLVLPALDRFCSGLNLADKARTNLSEALNRTDLLRKFRELITVGHCWLRGITPEGVHWVLQSDEKKVLRLPSPPKTDAGRPWRLFPSLRNIAKYHWLAVEGAPNILNSAQVAQWDEQNLLELLESIDVSVLFAESTLLDYLISFLDVSAGPFLNVGTVKRRLERLIQRGLVDIGEESLGRSESRVRQIVSYLAPTRCLRVDNQLPASLLHSLLSGSSEVLVIPARFWPGEWQQEVTLSIDNAFPLLQALQDTLSPQSNAGKTLYDAAVKLAEQLIKSVAVASRPGLLRLCSDLYVLRTFDCQADKVRAASPQEIVAARQEGLLFGYAQGTRHIDRLALAPQLQSILACDRVLIINAETANLTLGVERSLRACDGQAVLQSLGQKPRVLAELRLRTQLAGQLGEPVDEHEIRGLRYLLHAKEAHFEASDPLWILGDEQHPVWLKLWGLLVSDEPWNLLQAGIADRLSREVARSIGIKEIRADSVIEEIFRNGTSVIDSTGFDQDECEEVLRAVADEALWLALPFHWTLEDRPISAKLDHVFLALDEQDFDERLLSGVHLISRSQNIEISQRQKQLLRPMDHGAVVELALARVDLPGIWREILDRLQSIEEERAATSPYLALRIKSERWLPSASGGLFSPEDVIDFDGEVGLDRILAQSEGSFVTPASLKPDLQQHPFFADFREKYFSRTQAGIERLTLAIEDLDAYQIGNSHFDDSTAVVQAAKLLSSSSHLGWRLLANVDALMGQGIDLMPLVSGMRRLMSLEAITKLLVWIADQGAKEDQAISIFNRYLKLFADTEESAAELHRLKLSNEAGNWVESEKLVSSVVGVVPEHVLDRRQASILQDVIEQRRSILSADTAMSQELPAALQPSAAAGVLREYFINWSGIVSPSLIGAFTLLFGRDESIKLLCEELLGQHSREWLMDQLPQAIIKIDGSARPKGVHFSRALESCVTTVQIHDSDRLEIQSIIGKPIYVSTGKEFSNLFIGRPSHHALSNDRGFRVDFVLRKLDVDQFSGKHLSSLLQSSVEYLLREVYGHKTAHLDALWAELDTADQVDIELARSLILRNIPFYLKQLRAHKYPSLTASLNRFREEERKEQEYKGTSKEAQYRREKEKVLAELQETIELDRGVQRAILESVRRKIRDFQYQAESIPFELFQNADDALQHLALIDAYPSEPGELDVEPLPASICRFVVEADGGHVVFMNWGRAINQFGSNGFPGRERGFDRDLENILILSASDKSDDVTGKFGLGFKSVWLASDRPVLVSGRLQTEIAGGLLPVPATSAIAQPLRRRMMEWQSDSSWPGTAIDISLVDVTEDEVLDSFSRVAGVMVAFSRHIQSIDIVKGNHPSLSVSWNGENIPGSDDISIGFLRYEGTDLLVMKIALPLGAMLIGIGPQGFIPLPKAIPNIWVTAPIREQQRLGFAVNAMFEVDAGRSRLSASLDANRELAHRLGKQLSAVLVALSAAVETSWGGLVSLMQLDPAITPYRFWASLWRALMGRLPDMSRDSGSRVIAEALLGEGLNELALKHGLVPNGLEQDRSYLLRCTGVKTVLKGAMLDPEVQGAVSSASCFKALVNPQTSVTLEVSTWLKILVPEFASSKTQWQSESLLTLIMKLDNQKAIRPCDAGVLGRALNSQTLRRWEQDGDQTPHMYVTDFKAAATKGPALRFLSEGGTEEKSKALLSCGGTEEESLRWAFAPDQNRLGSDYVGSAIDFFYWCRDRLDAPSEKLKQWILSAEDCDRRSAALRYLVEGELAREVADALHETGIEGAWLTAIDERSLYLQGWDSKQCSKLVYQILKTPDESRDAWLGFETADCSEPAPIDPVSALQNIHEWWEDVREEKLNTFCRDTYPDGRALHLSEEDVGCVERSSWLTLLLLGGFHTMGRAKPVQHRQFIENCYRRGWWEVFTDPKHTQRFDDWMGVLDQYIDQQVDQQEYEQWMLRFPIIYKLSRHLDDYVELFLGLERYPGDFDLELALMPMADPNQQGGGISAPALVKSLGIGANFVIRELIRHGITDSQPLRQHAYVPTKKVTQLLFEMGCIELGWKSGLKASPAISSFLIRHIGAEKSRFCGDFDIPLRLVAQDWELQQKLLGRQLQTVEEL
tara:strand:- start:14694 stop:22307 length:7614 start_codon:yes stop_codon:yes gene_type:complete